MRSLLQPAPRAPWSLLLQGALLFSLACAPVSPLRRPASEAPPSRMEPEPELVASRTLRVLLQRGAKGLRVSAKGGMKVVHPRTGQALVELGPGTKEKLRAKGGRIWAGNDGLEISAAWLEAARPSTSPLVAGRAYRGRLILQAVDGELFLINQVPLESYLYGVLPSEVPSSWPAEALKAQAVAARTYALWRASKSASPHWDLDDSTASQAYLGRAKEASAASQAVDATEGQVLLHGGQLVQAFFHSNSGGYTADAADVWGSPLPYLRSVRDPYSEDQPHYAWSGEVSKAQTASLLARAGLWHGELESLTVLERDDSGRCLEASLAGGGRSGKLRCTSLRAALGADLLRSTNFKVREKGDRFLFEGLGWGHGVGLAQEGALAMAKRGYGYERILRHYYPGTQLRRL